MMLLSITFINRVTADGTEDSEESSKIDLVINKTKSDYERSINSPIIEAVWHSNIKQVEVTLYNIGDAEVHISNSQNQIISNTIVQTEIPTTVNLNVTGGQGTYYIVVMSDDWYAEGKFKL